MQEYFRTDSHGEFYYAASKIDTYRVTGSTPNSAAGRSNVTLTSGEGSGPNRDRDGKLR